ncbi:MAG: ABC transporter permease [Verrucomicrobiota bacterium]|nr:ABC transporter permease [Verrucomicrobiota bacterium]
MRSLLRRPGFTLVAIITLALGMGAATAIFSVLNAVLLRPLPYPQQERMVELSETSNSGRAMPFAEPNFADLAARSRSFEALARYSAYPEAVAGGSEAVRVNVCRASSDFFRVLGVTPQVGRVFGRTDKPEQVAVVSYAFWKRLLGEQPNLDSLSLRFDNRSFSVIGVLPPGVGFPPQAEIWFPAELNPPNESRSAHNWRAAGRLRGDVSLGAARAEIAAIGQQMKTEHGSETDAVSFGAAPLRERMVKDVRGVLFVICGAVGLLLFIACSNVGNLLLVRATSRRKEIALRAALGASRSRLAAHFITESLLLTLVAGVLGSLLAFWGVDLIVGLYHGNLPRIGGVVVDRTVLLFTLAIAILVGLVLGIVPVLHSSKHQWQIDLQDAGRGSSSSRATRRIRNGLIIAQVALTLVLLVGAGLLGRSFQRLIEVKPGFEPESALAMTVSMPQAEDPAAMRQLAQFYQQLIARLQTIPGVIAVGGVNALPMSGSGANGTFLMLDGGSAPASIAEFSKQMLALQGTGKTADAQYRAASADYFAALRIPLRRGRLFQEADTPDGQHVCVVSESLVRRYWSGADPIGKQLEFGNMDGDLRPLTVVGVVGDIHDNALDAEPQPTIYVNAFQRPGATADFSLVLRGRGDPAALIAAMRREAHAQNPEMPTKFQTLEQLVASSLDNRRFSMTMLAVFAGAALVLAMVGLYGIMAYITAERTTELGIRMALGAQRGDMLRLILRQSFALVSLGIAAGVVAAFAGTRLLASLLYGISAADLVTYGGVVLLLFVAALIATLVPARRAMSVDPMVALRHD